MGRKPPKEVNSLVLALSKPKVADIMPVQKLVLQISIMCDTDTLAEAVDAYSGMSLSQIEEAVQFGEDIGSGITIVTSETLSDREQIKAELLAIGNDGTFFDCNLDAEEKAAANSQTVA